MYGTNIHEEICGTLDTYELMICGRMNKSRAQQQLELLGNKQNYIYTAHTFVHVCTRA